MSEPNLARAIVQQARARPGLRLGTVDDQLELADAVGLAAARARALLSDGLRPGQRVALVAPTSTDYVLTWLACVLAGTPVALVNPSYPAELTGRMLAPLAPDLVLGPGEIAVARSAGGADPEGLPGLGADAFAVVSYMHTSGTTGLPKFCAQTHDYFARLAAAVAGALDLGPGDRVLAPLPLFHINPMGYGIITSLLTGADALTMAKFSASRFWPAVTGERVTVLILHAPPVQILKRATSAEDAAGHRVRTMFYADAEFLARFGVPAAVSGYGSTEAGGISHLTRWPAAGLDPARDADGWFDTGDLGRADGDDYLVFTERATESIRVKGEFVPIPFVEDRLAAVSGLTDHALWKRKGALVDDEVVLYAVGDPLPLDQLRRQIAGLPAFMRPVAVARVGALPRDAAAGKVQRRLLGDQPVLEWVELS